MHPKFRLTVDDTAKSFEELNLNGELADVSRFPDFASNAHVPGAERDGEDWAFTIGLSFALVCKRPANDKSVTNPALSGEKREKVVNIGDIEGL